MGSTLPEGVRVHCLEVYEYIAWRCTSGTLPGGAQVHYLELSSTLPGGVQVVHCLEVYKNIAWRCTECIAWRCTIITIEFSRKSLPEMPTHFVMSDLAFFFLIDFPSISFLTWKVFTLRVKFHLHGTRPGNIIGRKIAENFADLAVVDFSKFLPFFLPRSRRLLFVLLKMHIVSVWLCDINEMGILLSFSMYTWFRILIEIRLLLIIKFKLKIQFVC